MRLGRVFQEVRVREDPVGGAPPAANRWLSVVEIADYLGVSTDTVYSWVSKKQMPGHRVGRLWKFKTEEVDGWIRQGGAGKDSASEPENQR